MYIKTRIRYLQAKFEDTKGLIRSDKSKKDSQHNGQKKQRTKGQTTICTTLHRKVMIEQNEPH